MDIKQFGQALAKLGLPILGAALPVPGGAALGKMLGSILGNPGATEEEVLAELTVSTEALQKAKEFELAHQETLLRLQVEALVAVNKTMQTEASSDHWPTYSWRPFIGFMFGLYIFSFVLLPLFGVMPIVLSADLTLAVGGILGIASWFRGKMQSDPSVPTDNRG